MSRSRALEKSMAANCRAAAAPGEPLAAVTAAMVGSRMSAKTSMRSRACRPMPMREWTSATAMAVTARAAAMGTTGRPLPSPAAS